MTLKSAQENSSLYESNTLSKTVVLVIGAGRSGTSLAMQFLNAAGLDVSDNLVSPRYHNPRGPMEDVDIATIYDKLLLPMVGGSRLLPFPWQDSEAFKESLKPVERKLQDVLVRNVSKAKSLWGFKEPYTSFILPIWFKIFNKLGFVPKIILCIRNPASVAISRGTSFGQSREVSELAWLSATISALDDSGGDLFILHYEDWFENPMTTGKSLLEFATLNTLFEEEMKKLLDDVFYPNLNRSHSSGYDLKNGNVKRLYSAVCRCHGINFDRDALMSIVSNIKSEISEYSGWYQMAISANLQASKLLIRSENLLSQVDNINILQARIKELEKELLRYSQLDLHLRKVQWQFGNLEN